MKFISEVLSNKDNISSKRLLAFVLILVYISVLYISINKDINETTVNLAEGSLWGALGLLGTTVIEKFKK